MDKKILKFLFAISLIINLMFLFNWLIYSTSLPEYKVGVLTQNLKIYPMSLGSKSIITLPQGLIVKNETPRGLAEVDLFEPYAFSILVSSSKPDLVNYSNIKKVGRGAVYTTEPQDES